MHLRSPLAVAVTMLTLVACVDEQPPLAPAVAPSLAVSKKTPPRRHLVRLTARREAREAFAERVTTIGGTMLGTTAGGIAVVTGLSDAAVAELAGDSQVERLVQDVEIRVEPSPRLVEGADAAALHRRPRSAPEEAELFDRQWNMGVIDVQKVWRRGKLGSRGVRVAILDTGVDPDHVDLAGLVDRSLSRSFLPPDHIDYFLMDHPLLFPGRQIERWGDLNGHGTHVANTVSSNAIGIAGMSTRTTIIAVKTLGVTGGGFLGDVLLGLDYAAGDADADVINMSLGSFISPAQFPTPADFDAAVEFLNSTVADAQSQGALVVVASGNNGLDLDNDGGLYNAFCDAPAAVCVGATGPRRGAISGRRAFIGGFSNLDEAAVYSNFGRPVDVSAPGGNYTLDAAGNVISGGFIWQACSSTTLVIDVNGNVGLDVCTTSRSFYAAFVGTSQASPHVAGLAALLAVEVGEERPRALKALILLSADDLGRRGDDPFYGVGRINAARAFGLR